MPNQQELFQRDWAAEFLDSVIRGKPKEDRIKVSDAALWMNRSNSTVIALCEQGELVAANLSTGTRREFEILTESIIDFYKRRLGIEK